MSTEDKLRLIVYTGILLFIFGIGLISVPMAVITLSLFILLIFGTALYYKINEKDNNE